MHIPNNRLYLDPRDNAELLYYAVEGLFKQNTPDGIFLPWQNKPVLQQNAEYYVKNQGNDFSNVQSYTLVTDLALIPAMRKDIYNVDGRLVLMARDARIIITESVLPVVEFDVLEALIENVITDMSSWISPGNKPDPFDVVKNFVISEQEYWATPGRQHSYEDWCTSGIITVLRMTEHFLGNVTRFIGEDTTIIHTLVRQNGMFIIEKTIDYRISEYDRLKSLGVI
jgi:hypothetical protein